VAVGAVHASGVAPAVLGVLHIEQGLAKGEQGFHAFVAAGEEAFAGFVALDHGAGPAAEAGIPTARGAGIDVDRALAAAGVLVEPVEVAV